MAKYSTEESGGFRVPPGTGKKVAVIAVVIACLIVVAGSAGMVGAGQRGVMLRFGTVTGTIIDEGLYFKIPFADQVALMSTQIQKYTAPVGSSSKDLQLATTEVTLNYQLNAGSVGETYRNMRQDYESPSHLAVHIGSGQNYHGQFRRRAVDHSKAAGER